jgi:hypothetical protein
MLFIGLCLCLVWWLINCPCPQKKVKDIGSVRWNSFFLLCTPIFLHEVSLELAELKRVALLSIETLSPMLSIGSSKFAAPSNPMNKASSSSVFFIWPRIYSQYIKIIGIKLASLENVFQYESDDTSYVQYNQDFVLNFRSQFALQYVCAFIETKVVRCTPFSSPRSTVFLFSLMC